MDWRDFGYFVFSYLGALLGAFLLSLVTGKSLDSDTTLTCLIIASTFTIIRVIRED